MSVPPFTLTILGTGSAIPLPDRSPSAQVIRFGMFTALIDCGEGTQVRMRECRIKPFQVDAIFISHLHGDHVFGLPGLLSSMNHLGRDKPLQVFGPPGLGELVGTVSTLAALDFHFPLEIRELRPAGPATILTIGDLDISAFPLDHRVPTVGYMFRERHPRVRFDKDEIIRRGLSDAEIAALAERLALEVPAGDPDNGRLFEVFAPAGFAYCSDTRYAERIAAWTRGVPVIYHETTFLDELADLAAETGHSTAAQAGRLAAAAGAGWLITGHYSSRYKDTGVFVEEARRHFPRVLASHDGAQYDLRDLGRILLQARQGNGEKQ